MSAAQIGHTVLSLAFLTAGTVLLLSGHTLAGPLLCASAGLGWFLLVWMMVSDAYTKRSTDKTAVTTA
jgi:hypothetical protein